MNYTLTDDYGRRTSFSGEKLIFESTDNGQGNKPQWVEVSVWLTDGGNWVVQRDTHYRIRHLRDACARADGYDLVDATELDTYPCPTCNKAGSIEPGKGLAQTSRIKVDVYHSAQDLISSFEVDGTFSNLSRSILADLCEQNDEVDELWNEVHVD